MRANFHLMKALSDKTRIAPGIRMNKLLDFSKKLASTPKIMEDFRRWNFKLDKALVDVPGRVLAPEKILFGKSLEVTPKNADWNFEMQDRPAFSAPVPLKTWVVLVTGQLKDDAVVRPKIQ